MHGVRVCSDFIDLHAADHLSMHHLLKRLSFSHFMFVEVKIKISHPDTSVPTDDKMKQRSYSETQSICYLWREREPSCAQEGNLDQDEEEEEYPAGVP